MSSKVKPVAKLDTDINYISNALANINLNQRSSVMRDKKRKHMSSNSLKELVDLFHKGTIHDPSPQLQRGREVDNKKMKDKSSNSLKELVDLFDQNIYIPKQENKFKRSLKKPRINPSQSSKTSDNIDMLANLFDKQMFIPNRKKNIVLRQPSQRIKKQVKWYKDEDENQRQKELQAKQKLKKQNTLSRKTIHKLKKKKNN